MMLGNYKIGIGHAPFIIAEMSGNHNHSLDRALAIVDAAAAAGAHALKLQTYTPDTMTIDCRENEFFIQDKKSLWEGKSLYDLYKIAMTPWDWHKPIFDRCREKGIHCFSTPFDDSAVDFLERLETPFYKIASFENNHLPLIRRVARTGKPTIISLGMTSLDDIELIVETYKSAGGKDLVLLKCTSAYPSKAEEANLKTIPFLRDHFGVEVGLSDHTMGWTLPVVATTLGATVIEKHFTLKRSDGGVDSAFSMEPDELAMLVSETAKAVAATGAVHFGLTEDEKRSKVFRRSIYITRDVRKGDTLSPENTRIIRPGLGLDPKHFEEILGRQFRDNYKMGTALSWDKLI